MPATRLKETLRKLDKNLNILREREAKHAGNAPPELLNQIDDHSAAIDLTEQAIAGQLSEAEWQEALKPLLVAIDERSAASEICQVTIGDIGGDVRDSIIAGRDVHVVIYNYPPPPAPPVAEADIPAAEEPIPDNPYLGLFAFRPEHAHLFFGRETFTDQLVRAVDNRAFVLEEAVNDEPTALYEAAHAIYDEAINLNGANPATRYDRARVLTALSAYEAALADLDQVVSLAHNPQIALSEPGQVAADFADREQMIQAVRRLIKVNPALGQVLHDSSSAYPNLQQTDLVLAPTPTPSTDEKGVKMVLIDGGSFSMGSNSGDPDEGPVHEVHLDAFYIDQTEVTNGQYAQCEAAGRCEAPPWTDSYSRERYYGDPAYDDYPVIGVTWEQAKTYCEWREGRLPSEAEWEKAARGTDGRTYPWGELITCQVANYGGVSGEGCVGDTSPVGAYAEGVSPYGVYDMGGNLFEWVADWYDSEYYVSSPVQNPLGPQNNRSFKVLRGGGWADHGIRARASIRLYYEPGNRGDDGGFRCAAASPG